MPGEHVQSDQNPLAIIIPTYNRVDALSQCLRHLENQTWKQFDVVVVDDGSTDSTPEFLDAYARVNRLGISHVRQKNGGPARARNLAISLVEAPLCLMIGDDIFASPELVERHLRLHQQNRESAVAVVGLTQWSETNQKVTSFMRWLDSENMQFDYERLLKGLKPDWRHFYTSNLSVKTEILKQFPFDTSFPYAAMEDMELACRIERFHGLEIKFDPEAIAYHLHPTTFDQACGRMIRVGESTAHFNAKWPGKMPRIGGSELRALKRTLISAPGVLPILRRLGNVSLKFGCPNRLMKLVLGCHFKLGYWRYAEEKTIHEHRYHTNELT